MIKFSRPTGLYGCFSNFYRCPVEYDGLCYNSSEAAWQSLKTLDLDEKQLFTKLSASESKRMGRRVKLREDWEDLKYILMVDVCYAKFSQNPKLKEILLSTGDEYLEESTTWHDNLWGNCVCTSCSHIKGKNLLGHALMEVRNMLK